MIKLHEQSHSLYSTGCKYHPIESKWQLIQFRQSSWLQLLTTYKDSPRNPKNFRNNDFLWQRSESHNPLWDQLQRLHVDHLHVCDWIYYCFEAHSMYQTLHHIIICRWLTCHFIRCNFNARWCVDRELKHLYEFTCGGFNADRPYVRGRCKLFTARH